MDQQAQSLIDRIKQAQNVLVTVSVNPSVDQLAAAIGLTIALNKMDKHGTAVFSGQVPSTIEFLKPEDTLEKNTDSLRDFIIALDKSKADKLRYKVEDQVVRIFITPYKTSLSEKDLEFSQGDFNVDVVVALGVAQQQDIDAAIAAHGRILHDATVASVSVAEQSNLGTINWADTNASSLSEMMLGLIDGLDKKLLDNQIATALLTGIVAGTDRFRNEKTSPKAMSASAELMAAGANQQLIATELETPPPEPEPEPAPAANEPDHTEDEPQAQPPAAEPGELDIDHEDDQPHDPDVPMPPAEPVEDNHEGPKAGQPQIHVDENGMLSAVQLTPLEPPKISQVHGVKPDGTTGDPGMPEVRHERMTTPPTLGDVNLTANTAPEAFDASTEELTLPPVSAPLLRHNGSVLPQAAVPPEEPNADPFIPQAPLQPAPPDWQPPVAPPLAPTPPPVAEPPVAALPLSPPAPAPVSPPEPVTPVPTPVPLPPAPPVSPTPLAPMPAPPVPSFVPPAFSAPMPPSAAVSPASASLRPDETLAEIEQAVRSPHLQQATQGARPAPAPAAGGLADARSAVQAAFNAGAAAAGPLEPIAALNAQPLGSDLHSAAPVPPIPSNTGFSEPTPGNTPADATLDMPLPSNPFGPPRPTTSPALPPAAPPPSSFPAAPPAAPGVQGNGQTPPPPVPPPMLPPLQ